MEFLKSICRYNKVIKLTIFLIFTSTSFGQFKAKLDTFLNIVDSSNRGMGIVSIFKNGKECYSKAFGYCNIENKKTQLATTQNRYRIGSITKIFTAILVLQLIEEGKLSYNTTLNEFFPKVPNAEKITIQNMLYHQSGIYDLLRDTIYLENIEIKISKENYLNRIYKSKSYFLPNEKSEYSNANFILLGYIVEKIRNKAFGTLLSEKITKPMCLTLTKFGGNLQTDTNDCNSFERINNKWVRYTVTDELLLGAAGGIQSTAEEINRLMHNLFAGKILSQKSLSEMCTVIQGYGMGIIKLPYYERVAYGHTGGIDGFRSIVAYFPDDSVSVCYLSNAEVYPRNELFLGLLNNYYDKPFIIPTFKNHIVPFNELHKYTGNYENKMLPLSIRIFIKDSTMFAQATNQPAFVVDPARENTFTCEKYNVTLEFFPATNLLKLYQGGQTHSFVKKQE